MKLEKLCKPFVLLVVWLLPVTFAIGSEIYQYQYDDVGENTTNTSMSTSPEKSPPTWWFNIGIGTGWAHNDDDNLGSMNRGAGHISFNGTFTPNVFLTVYGNVISSRTAHYRWGWDEKEARESGVMLGYVDRKPNWYWSLSAGLAHYEYEVTKYVREQNWSGWSSGRRYTEETGIGVPVQLQTFWTPFSHFGVGMIGHVMLGDTQMANVFLGLQIF